MDLLVLSLEGEAGADDLALLKAILRDSDEARDYYIQAVSVVENIRKMEWAIETAESLTDSSDSLSQEFWNLFAEQEKIAPAIHLQKENSETQLIQKVVYPPVEKKPLSRFSIATLILSAAALVFILIFVKVAPVNRSVEVATLKDSINARWGQDDMSMNPGDRLISGSNHSLLGGGIITLLFDNDATVTIEGPAEFEVLSVDRLKLQYGQLYSIVPKQAIGFSVTTPNAMVIDLGTQFGIQVDFRGNTELHVNKGKTMLISGDNKSKMSQEVREGAARKVSALTMQVSEIPCEDNVFVRQIDSKNDLIWRGQSAIDLSDVFCGGNGLGTGLPEGSIDPITGEILKFIAEDREGSGQYVTVRQRRFVDGVFVPDGHNKPVVVSSQNHVFSECPPTNNVYYFDPHKGIDADRLNFDGLTGIDVPAADAESPASLMLHANLGVTFDLDAIREVYPLADITQFKSWVGISSNAIREGNLDVWVLVDGQLRYSQKQIHEKGRPYPIRVDLKSSDRFLTLAVTDGGDKDVVIEAGRATDSDWCLFVQPELQLVDKAPQ
mgnify:CR=1 FL=1